MDFKRKWRVSTCRQKLRNLSLIHRQRDSDWNSFGNDQFDVVLRKRVSRNNRPHVISGIRFEILVDVPAVKRTGAGRLIKITHRWRPSSARGRRKGPIVSTEPYINRSEFSQLSSRFTTEGNVINPLNLCKVIGTRITIDLSDNPEHGFQQPQILLQHVDLKRRWIKRGQIVVIKVSKLGKLLVPKILIGLFPNDCDPQEILVRQSPPRAVSTAAQRIEPSILGIELHFLKLLLSECPVGFDRLADFVHLQRNVFTIQCQKLLHPKPSKGLRESLRRIEPTKDPDKLRAANFFRWPFQDRRLSLVADLPSFDDIVDLPRHFFLHPGFGELVGMSLNLLVRLFHRHPLATNRSGSGNLLLHSVREFGGFS